MKKKYRNCGYYFLHYIESYKTYHKLDETHSFSCLIPILSRPNTNSDFIEINYVQHLEGFASAKDQTLVETVLRPAGTSKYPKRIYMRQSMEHQVFQFSLKHSLLDLMNFCLEYLRESKDPSLMALCMRSAIIYDKPEILKQMLRDRFHATSLMENRLNTLCTLLNREECKNVLGSYCTLEKETLNAKSQTHELFKLLKDFNEDFNDEIITALRQIPNATEECKNYFDRNLINIAKKPHLVQAVIDLGINTDDFESSILVRILKRWRMGNGSVRETVKLLLSVNIDLEQQKEDILCQGLRQDSLCYTQPIYMYIATGAYKTDFKEHGFFEPDEDFALNFVVPFFLECGLPTTRRLLEYALTCDIHPAEHKYIQNYLTNYINNPRPLDIICRQVLRKCFKGIEIISFLEKSNCQEKIKDFILMKSRLEPATQFNEAVHS